MLLDQNLSYKLEKQFHFSFEEVKHVKTLGLHNALDADIWQYAKQNDFSILTRDADFNDIGLLRGFPPKIIWLRIGNLKTAQIAQLIHLNAATISAFLEELATGILEIFALGEF